MLQIEAEEILELVVNKTEKLEIAVGDVCNVHQSLSFRSKQKSVVVAGRKCNKIECGFGCLCHLKKTSFMLQNCMSARGAVWCGGKRN